MISLIIPALNEQKTIGNILKRCLSLPEIKQIIVVNDGSTDQTAKILDKEFSKHPKITIIHHPRNMGKGAAIKNGLKKTKYKYVMIQDADLEYSPEEIKHLLKKAQQIPHQIVFGTRSKSHRKGYLLARIGNWYLNQMFNALFGVKLTDSYTCYKLIPKKIWQQVDLQSNGFEIDSELIAKLAKLGLQIEEVPISYNPRKYSEGKKIKWKDLIKATTIAFKIKFLN